MLKETSITLNATVCNKKQEARVFILECVVIFCLILGARSAPQPIDLSVELRQGSGKFVVLQCVVSADCSDSNFLITQMPGKGQLFRVKGSPHMPVSTFKRSALIETTGVQLSNRIIYYLPFHEISAVGDNMIVTDAFSYKADAVSAEARCLIEILKQPLLPIGGGSGYSLLFDGIDDIVVTQVDSWFPTDAFTVMMWIRVYDRLKQATIFSFFGAKGRMFEIWNPRNLTCVVGFSALAPSNIDVSDGKWHHIAATWSSTSLKCQLIVDATISAVAFASHRNIANLENTGTIVLGNRQACDILDSTENRAEDINLKQSQQVTAIPIAGNNNFKFSTTPSKLLLQHAVHRVHGSAAPKASYSEGNTQRGDLNVNSRQRSDYLLCRCAGGCFHPSLAFGGEMDDVRVYSFEKTMPEIRVESKYVFLQANSLSEPANKTRPQLEQQFFGLQLWLTFDDIVGVAIKDDSGQNRSSFRGSSAKQRFPCHKKREPFQIVSSTGVLGGFLCFKNINANSRIEIKLPGITGIGNTNETLLPKFRFNQKYFGSGLFYHAACGYSGTLTSSMIAQGKSEVGPSGCIIFVPNQQSLAADLIEYSISNVKFPTLTETDPEYVEIKYNMSFLRESSVIPSNYMVGLQNEKISVVKLMLTRPNSNRLHAALDLVPQHANVWIAFESRCADIPQCEIPVKTVSWETSGSSFIESSSFSRVPDWKYIRPPFATSLYQEGPLVCNTDKYFTPEPTLPSKVCKIGKYFLNNSIFTRPRQGAPLFLESSKWDWEMLELVDFSSLPYGGSNANNTFQGVTVECLIYDGSFDIPLDNCTCCYISNCFPVNNRVMAQSAMPLTPAAVLRAVLSQNVMKLESLMAIRAPFDRSAINAAAALGNLDILRLLFSHGSPLWDYDAIQLSSDMGSWAALTFLQSRTALQGYEGQRSGLKCLVRGDFVSSFTGFVTSTSYVLASGKSGVTGQLGFLQLRWSQPELTDKSPNFPVSRLQKVSFWGLLSAAPRPDGRRLIKNGLFQGVQNEPVVIKPTSSISESDAHTCVRPIIKKYPANGNLYNLDDLFENQLCKNRSALAIDERFCREFGTGVYFSSTASNQSAFSNTTLRPIVYPSRILNPVFEPMSGVKISKNQDLLTQSPLGILNASMDSSKGLNFQVSFFDSSFIESGPQYGKDGGREDLVLLHNFSWDTRLEYGEIGSKSNTSFRSICGSLGVSMLLYLMPLLQIV